MSMSSRFPSAVSLEIIQLYVSTV
uniref:Uncharacterized protein n=1 Tax=Arundo donax TaxID=35708 RepID=A0A0A9FQ61_ARUDO